MARVRRRTGADAEGRRHGSARATPPSGCATRARASSSTSSRIPTIRSRTIAAPGPEIWRDTGGDDHALRVGDGNDRHHHGRVALPQGEESGDRDHRRAARGRLADPRHPQVARGLPAEDLRPGARRPHRVGVAGRGRGHRRAGSRARKASSAASRPAAPAPWRCASRAKSRTRRSCSSSAIAATATCRPASFPVEPARGPRRASPTPEPRPAMTPILVFDIETVPDVAGLRRAHALPAALDDAAVLEWAIAAAPRADRRRFPAAALPAGGRDRLRAARRRGVQDRVGRRGRRTPSPS